MTATLIRTPPYGDVARVRRSRRRRYVSVVLALAGCIVVLSAISLCLGDFPVSLSDVLRTLVGRGSTVDDLVVVRLRLPRVALGAVAGAALAMSGALLQSLLRNTLASPDLLGVTGGASVAAVFATLILGLGGLATTGCAALGALAVALVIHVLAGTGGGGQRFVLIGVAMASMTTAVLGYLLSRADVLQAHDALVWLVGGVGDARWRDVAAAAVPFAVLVVLAVVAAPVVSVLQLGDDTARSLGVPVDRRRVQLLALAVALAAVGTAATGPLAFVALISAPVARRLLRDGAPALLPSAAVGVVMVLGADLLAQHAVPGMQLPAGVITGAVGAPYLLWLLTRSTKEVS